MGEHQQLTRGPLSDWWLPLVRAVNPHYSGGSTQGYYVIAADGSGLAADNYPPRLRAFLELGVERHRRRPGGDAGVTADDERRAAPQRPPDGAAVLRLFSRVQSKPGETMPGTLLARDYMWVLADELRALAAARDGPAPLPRTLAARLVVFHLVDGTRGQVWPWQPPSVTKATFTATPVRASGTVRTFKLRGEFAKRDSHPPQWRDRGQEGTVEGEFDLDTAALKFVRFRAYAECVAWSDATYSPMPPPKGRYRLATAITEANDELARQVTPEPAFTGQHYLRPMVPGR